MDYEARRLVDDQQMFVLEGDPQRNVLSYIVSRLRLRNRKLKSFPATNLGGRVADGDRREGFESAAADQGFEALTRKGRNGIGQRTIEPPARMARQKLDADDLVAPHTANMGIGFGNSMT